MTEPQAATTRFCARVIGPLMLIMGAVVIARFDDIALVLPAFFHDAPLVFVVGAVTLIAGLVLLAAHHHWSNATAVLITFFGVLTTLRGIVLLVAPGFIAAFAANAMRATPVAFIAGAIALLLGLWLTYAGWLARPKA